MTVSYEDLVAAATVGIAQRPLEFTELAGPAGAHTHVLDGDPAGAVLDAAALLDAARRAGGLRAVPVELPPAAAADATPELGPLAGAILRAVVGAGDRELAAELLTATARAGLRAPVPELPDLLDLGARDASLRGPVGSVLGERGHWLAAHQPEWARVADTAPAVADDPDVWQTGRIGERIAWLTAMRRRDPAAARDLLASGWTRETAGERPALLAVLAERRAAEDEPFLDAALDDRNAKVRRLAAKLLAGLPGSAFTSRAIARAAPVLRIERRGLRQRLVVTPPAPPDEAALRDGLVAESRYRLLGDSGWHVVQVIAAAPLGLWPDRLGADAQTLADLDVVDFGAEVHAGWRLALRRERDPEWAQALLSTRRRDYLAAFTPPDEHLVDFAPAAARAARAVAALRGHGTPAAVLACPVPWPAEVTKAFFEYLVAQLGADSPAPPGSLPGIAARGMDLAGAAERIALLRDLADRFRVRTAGAPLAGRWPAALERAADLLDLRHRFHRELQ